MRRLALCLVLTMSLAPAGAAVAKEPVKAKVCGASDCRETKDRGALMALTEGGPPTSPPRHGAAWYRVTMTIEIDRGRHERAGGRRRAEGASGRGRAAPRGAAGGWRRSVAAAVDRRRVGDARFGGGAAQVARPALAEAGAELTRARRS
jgi:hypothetical protein